MLGKCLQTKILKLFKLEMCVCVWLGLFPNRTVTRILCWFSVVVQMLLAILLLYFTLEKGKGIIEFSCSITFFIVMLMLSAWLIDVIVQHNLLALTIYIVTFAFSGVFVITYLLLVVFNVIDKRDPRINNEAWKDQLLAVLFTVNYVFTLAALHLYRATILAENARLENTF